MIREKEEWIMTLFRGLLLGMLFSLNAIAQTFPGRPVTFIVPWPPGGSTDLAMRSLSVIAEKHLGQRIVIENKPGVSGTMGAQALAQGARPDGYTISQMPITVFRLPHMTKMAFDPMSDFTYIIHLTGYTFGVVVRADSPHKTWQDLVAWARANPGMLTYATPGNGTSLHITMETIAQRDGITWTQVPFKGYAEGAFALAGGHVMAHADSTGWGEQVTAVVVKRLGAALGDPPHNFILHSNPLRDAPSPSYHWHIEVMPALAHTAGFEWGSGFYINPTPPEDAAKFLREIKL